MADGDPIFSKGFTADTAPVLQPGSHFSNRTYGLDDGRRTFLIHPNASQKSWPAVGDADTLSGLDSQNPSMYIVDVSSSQDPSTLKVIECSYRGIAGTKPDRVTPDADIQMLTLPGTPSGGGGATGSVIVPVPVPKVRREYVTKTKPTYTGVGLPVTGGASWLPSPPSWTLTFTPDSSQPPTYNYFSNTWVLNSRTWEEIIPGKLWFVRESATYYFSIASA